MGEDGQDALAYSPAGFIWDNALKHRVSIRNYGEFMAPAVTWRDGRKGTPISPRVFARGRARATRPCLRVTP